ncbi:polysaccharide deacetylase family sporulation protein PdaB [Evansella cellulosilytica]|uniref:Polysaccharide deacetylase family sporulation protein PdaB n=1 Tax=Evansella cellulosilytica (strain ATCC 21833 / DSM 2522 / FERM P-1141 / JCM 9156 / N-4) TaxID=649639 RepID=E6TTB4_EVAC2|nr:polysaccharide deacetylase family sporulation protein PdaB [Evansella cellulosilytica]ADU28454.1 polysaccharide deacetylase family sporulation protein PdaB [Evansella cellulosilytica DSM 2522]
MNFIWVWNAKTLKRYAIIAVAALFTAGILFVERSQIPVFSTDDQPVAIYKVDAEEKEVALTFNVSWGEERALPILDTLKEHDVTSTFFVSADWAERHPEIVERIVEDGHELGSHGYVHEHYTKKDDEQIKKDIQTAHRIIQEVSQEVPNLLRPPNGSFDERVLSIAENQNYDVIHWSVDSNDWQNPGVDTIVENVTRNISNGDIVLMHASDSAKQTNEALAEIISYIESEGYHFNTVSELVSGAEVVTKEVQ